MVAGLAAYLRGLPSRWAADLQDPRQLKALIKLLQRKIPDFAPQPVYMVNSKAKVPTVWNGQVFEFSCLLDTKAADPAKPGFPGDAACPNIDDIKKPDADKLPLSPGGVTGGETITYQPGAPSPTCTAHCGKLCTGFFCVPNPTGNPNNPSSSASFPATASTTLPSGRPSTSSSLPATTLPSNPSCKATPPQKTNPPPPGTACTTDVSCSDFLCPACQWAGCLQFSPASGLTCQCLPTTDLVPGANTCAADYDCARFACGAGQRPSCLQFSPGAGPTCQCVDMLGAPPPGTACSKTWECSKYRCPQGQAPGCVQFSPGAGPTCQCMPV